VELIVSLLLSLPLFLLGQAASGLWIGAVVYVYVDATRRNVACPALWAVGTFFTGPLALVAYLVDRPRGRLIRCGFCKETIQSVDRRCPYCGREQGASGGDAVNCNQRRPR